MKTMTLALALTLSACALTPEQIRDLGTSTRAIGEEIRLTRCSLIPNARIEELRSCKEDDQ